VANRIGVWDGLSLDELLQVAGFVSITVGLLVLVFIYSKLNYRHLLTNVTKYRFRFNMFPKKKWRSFFFEINRNKIITTRSAKKFYYITSMFLVGGYIKEVVEIIGYNLTPLVQSARQYTSWPTFPGQQNRERPKSNGTNYAFETLYQILTDNTVMKQVCTSNRFFLRSIVANELKDNNGSLHNEFADILYSNVVSHLILNSDSFIYTQTDSHSGSARFENVYDLLTDNKITKRQRIIPSLLTWEISKTNIPLDEYVGVLLKLLDRMVVSYKKEPGNKILLDNIRQILDQLIGDSGVTRNLAFDQKAKKNYANDIVRSMAFKVFSKLHLAFNTDLSFKTEDPEAFRTNSAELKSENKRGKYEQTTLTGLLAAKVYELIEDLIIFYENADDPDASLMREVFSYIQLHVNTPVAIRYEELLWERLFDKAVDGKFEIGTNIQGNYPYILRFIINFLTPFVDRHDKQINEAQVRLKDIMANELKEALLSDKKMNGNGLMKDALLPPKIKAVVNKRNKSVKYQYIDNNGKKTYLNLEKPTATNQKSSTI